MSNDLDDRIDISSLDQINDRTRVGQAMNVCHKQQPDL